MALQAFLPDEKEEIPLENLMEGESVWTVPWAMYADSDGSLWLNGNYTCHHNPGWTVQMIVSKRSGMYICDITNCKGYKWSRRKPSCAGGFTPLPVSKLLSV